MDEANAKEKLDKLLVRRKDYFLLEGIRRKIYQADFERLQRDIIHLKLILGLYHDELDMLEVTFNYREEKYKVKICEEAAERGEVRWLKKSYVPMGFEAIYVALVKKPLSDPWLEELFQIQQLKRAGYIDCPWPTVLGDEENK